MIVYLTIGEQPSAIYTGQVIDVVRFIQTVMGRRVKLIAFISGREFFKNRKIIKSQVPAAIVIPMMPGLRNWKKNRFVLYLWSLFVRPHTIIARNILATKLAIHARDKGLTRRVILDGRGAIAAEWQEYDVVQEESLRKNISAWEKEAVLQSDYQIAVSRQLVAYWEKSFDYKNNTSVVIPCTINQSFLNLSVTSEAIAAARQGMRISKNAIVLVYSGSIAGWQSFALLSNFLQDVMGSNENVVLYFLSNKTKEVQQLVTRYPGRVFQKQVSPEQVGEHLIACDYGLLIRDGNTTNEVASPVKFAEYLAAGLKVIISRGIGDYSVFVKENECGHVVGGDPLLLNNVSLEERFRNRALALEYYTKEKYLKEYTKILN